MANVKPFGKVTGDVLEKLAAIVGSEKRADRR
jgi:hypothetical protein